MSGTEGTLPRHVLRLDGVQRRAAQEFALVPDGAARAALAGALGISAVGKLRLEGRLLPEGRQDWRLEARLRASVVQPCVVTLAPVTTRIDEDLRRRYLADNPAPAPGESEMPDDEIEPLPRTLDLWEILHEALALALPPWPRAPDAGSGDSASGDSDDGATGSAPDAAGAHPFAGLAGLRATLAPAADDDGDKDAGGDAPASPGPGREGPAR
ncbi:MAG: DUF177 domain-containing protein [Rubellimicrobium sp.]|nr:DUF177 domain-containing protein [Rubellimicrobium sp.]